MRCQDLVRLSWIMFLAASPAVAAVPSYRVEYLGAGWTGTGMNEHGVVCGNVSPDGTALIAGVSHDGQPFEPLPLPPGMQSSRAHDINDAGVIVGAVCPNVYVITQPTAAVWRPTADGYEVEVLGALPGDPYSSAWAVNNDLDTGEIEEIPLPSGNWNGFVATALNEANDFCGYILGYSTCSTFPIRYRQGLGWEFLGGCATTTSATAINGRGDTLSYYYMTTAGVTFVDEGYYRLGSVIDPSQGVWYIQYGGANAINDARQIVASARPGPTGPIGAVRLTPMLLPGPGAVPDGGGPAERPLLLDKLPGGGLLLSWDVPPCATSGTDYAAYAGTIGQWTSHQALVCTTGGATWVEVPVLEGDRYFLVVPRTAEVEGSYGVDGAGHPRPPAADACLPQSLEGCP